MKIKKYIFHILLIVIIISFYSPFFIRARLPMPLDTIVGLYNPYRDLYAHNYPRGVPFKNFLITDPVRQTYIWKELSISIMQKLQLPLWNPYEMSGKPLLANFQSSPFYPLNILLLIPPFPISWSIFIFLQSLLGGFFLYLYLKNQKLNPRASLLGSVAFIFSGFFTSWLEWGTIVQTALWIPLILYAIDKIFEKNKSSKKQIILYVLLLSFSYTSSFFGGHLQSFYYIAFVSLGYVFIQAFPFTKENFKKTTMILLSVGIFIGITIIQWFPTLQYIFLSARQIDQDYRLIDGWFVPYKHLIQFIAPDFFGNPSTLNYWGTWNYGELVGYVGIVPLLFAIYAILLRINKRVIYFSFLFFLSLLFALPTAIGKLPYVLSIPLLSTAQPTRLLFLSCFTLSVLSSYGLNHFLNQKLLREKNNLSYVIGAIVMVGFGFAFVWGIVGMGKMEIFKNALNLSIAQKNLILPSFIFILSSSILLSILFSKNQKILKVGVFILLGLTVFDLLRFSSKFNTFAPRKYLYPDTKITLFFQQQNGFFRISSVDKRILPPNFLTHYKLQTVEGYDPLYLKSYGQYIVAMQRNTADISEPFGFNRIITPTNYSSVLYDLLNIKYVLSIDTLKSEKLKFLFAEGDTKVYENERALPRSFFVDTIIFAKDDSDVLRQMYNYDLRKTAVVENSVRLKVKQDSFSIGRAYIQSYSENKVVINTNNNKTGFLVLSDTFYPTWHVTIDGKESEIIKTNFTFRGVIVPSGNHTITFYITLF